MLGLGSGLVLATPLALKPHRSDGDFTMLERLTDKVLYRQSLGFRVPLLIENTDSC